jgi:hypothetical protein
MLTSLGLFRFRLVVGLCVVFLAGCNRDALIHKYAPPQTQVEAEGYFNQLRNHQMDQLEGELDTSLGSPEEIRETLARMVEVFPQGAPMSVKLVGYNRVELADVETNRISLEYEFPQKWLIADVTTQKRGEFTTVTEFHVSQVQAPLEVVNGFTLRGKGVAHYAMLLLWVLAIAVQLFAFYECIRTEMKELKWFWLIFIAFGVGRVTMNWATSETSFQLLNVQIPASMAWAAFYGPWILSVSLPVGAIVFLAKRRSLAVSAAEARKSVVG